MSVFFFPDMENLFISTFSENLFFETPNYFLIYDNTTIAIQFDKYFEALNLISIVGIEAQGRKEEFFQTIFIFLKKLVFKFYIIKILLLRMWKRNC